MPLHDFECPRCQIVFEELVRAGEVPPCPQCGGQSLRLLPRRIGIKFSGSGFYTTDYKKKDEKSQK